MNSAIRNRLLTILFVIGIGIYALLPSLRYGLMDESKKSNLSDEQIDYFESRSIKQGLDLKGGINAINGVYGAWTDSMPMIIISGQVKKETLNLKSSKLRQLGDQENDIISMVKKITKFYSHTLI